MILTMAALAAIISTIMIMIATLLSKKTFSDREKSSPFECGFDPKTNARIPFSIQFFLIAIIFLIFDVEITLLIPLVMKMKTTQLINYTVLTSSFLLILIIGVFHEWNQGTLEWSN
uniref:NADH-ubiquinone oxidoreductase chain 3 n=1 Tax=Trogoderma granarium TaxID=591392 RepID=A0A5H2V176_9COLE|nr:NADH dehydrogenase subunit 3 [Trogoderma granarium]QOW08024.1 NADH dehydrogenase subunit 3 [Trogoderma granarium]BBE28402.1 NADH dehydrogenase subunit 3 [Trogoderma granarium]